MITILLGKSSSGKDTVAKALVENKNYIPIVSWTTRPMRECETEGVEYHFCTQREFEYMIERDMMLEYRSYETIGGIWFYGGIKEELDLNNNYIVVLDLNGAKSFIDYYGKENCKLIYIEVSDEERTKRAKLRGSFSEKEWNRRMLTDEQDFSEEKLNEMNIDIRIRNENISIDKIVELVV